MGIALSAFGWTYALAHIPGGILLDRIGVRLTYFLSITLWSLCTAVTGLAAGLASLVAGRLALGIAEAPAFPCNSQELDRSEEHTSELQSHSDLVCRLLLEK